MTYLCCLNLTFLEDLLQYFIFVCGAEFVLECALACRVQDTLSAVAGNDVNPMFKATELEQTYLSVTKILKLSTTCARGMLESCFQF